MIKLLNYRGKLVEKVIANWFSELDQTNQKLYKSQMEVWKNFSTINRVTIIMDKIYQFW